MNSPHHTRQVLLIIIFGVAIRFIGIDQPLLEGAMTRQIQTAEITYNLFAHGFDIVRPQIHILPEPRYFIFEFPVFNSLVACLYKIFGVHEYLGRLISISAFGGTAWFIWLIASHRLNKPIGRAAVFAYSFFPLSIIFTRAFQPDPLALFFTVGSFYFFSEWLHEKTRAIFPALVLGILAFLSKQVFAFILLPMCLYALYRQKKAALVNPKLYIFIILTLLPALWWTWHGKQIYLEFPNYMSNTNLEYKYWFNLKFFGQYDFYKGIFQWLTGIILTPLGFFLFLTGFFVRVDQDGDKLIFFWAFGVAIFNFLFPLHAYTHEYYHLPLLPVASIIVAKAWWFFFEQEDSTLGFSLKSFRLVALTIFLISVLGYSNSGYRLPSRVKFFHLNTELLNKHVNDNDRIIVVDRFYLYYANNRGWVFHSDAEYFRSVIDYYEKDKTIPHNLINYIETLRRNGAAYFFISQMRILKENPKLEDYLRKQYHIAAEIKGVSVLFDLKKSFL